MKKLLFLSFGAFALFFASCASYQSSAPLQGIQNTNLSTYAEADLDYSSAQRVSGVLETKTLLGCIELEKNGNKTLNCSNLYRGLSRNEARALYRAKESSGADLILEPQFEVEKHSWFLGMYREAVIKVTGWGLKVKGIKEDGHETKLLVPIQ